ncbi:hypothetical protein Uis4E_0211 [Bifidobacterium parmae]|uniref:Uncharacterized protein n=1 Tax=Bifidobacterium parmae TaxID=361854 RepID=A0A2N5J6M6_9BIFI|nr:hypothetical protein Uis4E_0211 [Bifidobacterium parmae]
MGRFPGKIAPAPLPTQENPENTPIAPGKIALSRCQRDYSRTSGPIPRKNRADAPPPHKKTRTTRLFPGKIAPVCLGTRVSAQESRHKSLGTRVSARERADRAEGMPPKKAWAPPVGNGGAHCWKGNEGKCGISRGPFLTGRRRSIEVSPLAGSSAITDCLRQRYVLLAAARLRLQTPQMFAVRLSLSEKPGRRAGRVT